MKKRILSVLLAISMVMALIPTFGINVFAAGGLTRAEWITQLVAAFEMTVEDDSNMPDNYFSDISEEDSYYRDILLAVEFGVIDLEAGEAFEPSEPATREFAAQTLNACLQFQLDEGATYTFNESTSVTYPDDIQVAVNQGWFTLSSGNFLPNQAVTSAEATAMLNKAKTIIANEAVDENYNSQYEFANGVIVVPETTEIIIEGETVTIADYDENISDGDIFVVYTNGIPVPFKAVSVTKNDTSTVITTTKDGTEEAITSADSEGSIDIDLENFEVNELTTFSVTDTSKPNAEAEEMQIELYSINYDKKSKKLTASQSIKLGGSSVGTVSIDLTNMKLDHKVDTKKGEYEAIINANSKITTSLSFDLGDYAGIPSSLTLGYVPIEGIGSIALEMEYSIKGGITMAWTGDLKAGVAYARNSGFRLVKEYTKKDFSYTANLDLKVGLRLSAGFDVGVLSANVWATVGVKMSAKIQGYDSGTPKTCVTISGYLYANVGASATINYVVDKKTFSKQVDIYTESNSPVRVVNHYEDNVLVGSCSRGQEIKYHTSSASKYFNPYSNNARSSYGGSGSGISDEPVVIWEYETSGKNATITGYKGTASTLAIPSSIDGYKVTSIKDRVFSNKTYIKSVIIPNSIITIGRNAFSDCTSLESVVLSESLTTLEYGTFSNCALKSINIPDGVTKIGLNVFYNCQDLYDVTLPKTLEYIGFGAFAGCASLSNIEIPKSLKEVNTYSSWTTGKAGVFYNCPNLKNVNFQKGTTKIVDRLLSGCNSLEEITLPDTITTIGNNAFEYCDELKCVIFPKNLIIIGDGAFSHCIALSELRLPEYLTKIGNGAFSNCETLESVDIPQYVTTLGLNAFSNCTNIQKVKLSEFLEEIGFGAFTGCEQLESIEIPKSLNKVNGYSVWTVGEAGVFYNCANLKNITFETGTTSVPYSLFEGCNSLEKIVLPDTITQIGNDAFRSCNNLTSVKLSKNLLTIGDSAFDNCTSLTSINIPNTVNDIGSSAFNNCSNITQVAIPENITKIKNYTFRGCQKLTNIQLPNNLSDIGWYAFNNCISLQNISIPANCKSIGYHSFDGCTALEAVELKNGLEKIDGQAFYECDMLNNVIIPDTVTDIGYETFYGCDTLSNITLGLGIQEIENATFQQCISLESIKIPRFCTSIANNAFAEDIKLTKIYAPISISNIAESAFSYPSRMAVYGKSGSYAEEYANSRNMKFNAVNAPITSMSYADKTMSMSTYSSVMPKLNIEPNFDTDTVTFASSDENILRVSEIGAVTARNYGTAKITATASSGKTASIDITVLKTADSIRLDNSSLHIERGMTGKLNVTTSPSDAVDVLEWSSSNTDVAEVDQNGNITAKKKGTAIITVKASYSGVSDACTVTVYSNEIDVEGINLSRNSGEVVIGTDYPLTATILPENATNKNIVWTSTDETVATVSNGVITALSTGTTTITATTADGGFTAECEITVIPKTEIVSFTVEETDKFVTHLTADNVPDTAVIYIAAYDEDNRLVGIQSVILDNGTADTEFDVPDSVDFKAFIWYKNTLMPLAACVKYKLY